MSVWTYAVCQTASSRGVRVSGSRAARSTASKRRRAPRLGANLTSRCRDGVAAALSGWYASTRTDPRHMNPLYFLENYTEKQLRSALIEALRQRGPGATDHSEEGCLRLIIKGINHPGIQEDGIMNSWYGWRNHHEDEKDAIYRKIMTVVWSLVAEGIWYPRWKILNISGPHVGLQLLITERGERLIRDGSDHPLHSEFIDRLKARAPAIISPGVVSRLEDAIGCLSRGLCRPSMVMVGLAAEESLRIAHDAFVHLGHIQMLSTPFTKTVQMLRSVRAALGPWNASQEDKLKLESVLSFVDVVRADRNKASHPGAFNLTAFEVEERIRSSGFHLPIIWRMPIELATRNGFHIPDYS